MITAPVTCSSRSSRPAASANRWRRLRPTVTATLLAGVVAFAATGAAATEALATQSPASLRPVLANGPVGLTSPSGAPTVPGGLKLPPVVPPTTLPGDLKLPPVVPPTTAPGDLKLPPVVPPTTAPGDLKLPPVVPPTTLPDDFKLPPVVPPTEDPVVTLATAASCAPGPGFAYGVTVTSPPAGNLAYELQWRTPGDPVVKAQGADGFVASGEGTFEARGVLHYQGPGFYATPWTEVVIDCTEPADEPDPLPELPDDPDLRPGTPNFTG